MQLDVVFESRKNMSNMNTSKQVFVRCLSAKFFVSSSFEFRDKSKVFMVRQILLDTLCQLLKIQILPSVGSNVPADLNCPVSKL